MGETQHPERITPQTPQHLRAGHSVTDQVPPLISKKWLCVHFGLTCPGGKANTSGLYSKVLTPDVLESIGLTEKEVRRQEVRTFDRTTSRLLIQALGL